MQRDPGTKGSLEWWRTTLRRMGGRMNLPTELTGASPEDLAALEARVRRPLPASYRALLEASNGFPSFGEPLGRLLTASEVDWHPARHPHAAAPTPLKADPKWRPDIPLHSLEITEPRDGSTLLLHPKRGKGGGEWEVWLVGMYCSRSLTLPDFFQNQLRSLGSPE
jgi:hypothetical protein